MMVLSEGEVAGIAAGASLGCVLFILLVVFCKKKNVGE